MTKEAKPSMPRAVQAALVSGRRSKKPEPEKDQPEDTGGILKDLKRRGRLIRRD